MPIYSWVFTTNPASKQEITKKIEGDYITYVNVRFPPGPQGLLKVQFFYGNKQLFPEETGTFFAGDDEIIDWEEFLSLPEKPMPLKIILQNDDDTYPHSVYIRLQTKHSWQLLHNLIAKAIVSSLKGIFGLIKGLVRR